MVGLISVYHIRMFARTLAGIAAKLPSSVKYRIGKLKPLDAVPYALSDTDGLADFDATQGTQSRVTPSGKSKIEVKTLDSLVPFELPIPDVIKIDVEGEEEKVLRGSQKTLSEFRPTILCDYNDDNTLSILAGILLPLANEVLPGPPVIAIPR
jgi:FkbM family methyltransferase